MTVGGGHPGVDANSQEEILIPDEFSINQGNEPQEEGEDCDCRFLCEGWGIRWGWGPWWKPGAVRLPDGMVTKSYFKWMWGVFLLLCLTVCIMAGVFVIPEERSRHLAPLQTWEIRESTSKLEAITVLSSEVTAWTYTRLPETTTVAHDSKFGNFELKNPHPYEWHMDLRTGSTVNISACTNGSTSVWFMIFQGEDSYDNWLIHKKTYHKWVMREQLPLCPEMWTFQYPVTSYDRYYFVFYNPDELNSVFFWNEINTNRVELAPNASSADGFCHSSCTLPWKEEEFIILQSTSETGDQIISWRLEPRMSYWAKIWPLVFLGIMGLFGIWLGLDYWKHKNYLKSRNRLLGGHSLI